MDASVRPKGGKPYLLTIIPVDARVVILITGSSPKNSAMLKSFLFGVNWSMPNTMSKALAPYTGCLGGGGCPVVTSVTVWAAFRSAVQLYL